MNSLHVGPFSLVIGVALGFLGFLALGAQTAQLPQGPGSPDLYYSPVAPEALEFFTTFEWAGDADQGAAVTVSPGERLAMWGGNRFDVGTAEYAVKWPLVDADGDGVFDHYRVDTVGLPRAYLPPGSYVFASSPFVVGQGGGWRFAESVWGQRIQNAN